VSVFLLPCRACLSSDSLSYLSPLSNLFRPVITVSNLNPLFIFLAGARQIATGLNIAKHDNQKVFVTSMCVGSGMGMAGIFVNEQ
jgi:hypothetical protein